MTTLAAIQRRRIRVPLWIAAAVAWLALIAGAFGVSFGVGMGSHAHAHDAATMAPGDSMAMHAVPQSEFGRTVVGMIVMAVVMIVAMMFPLLTAPVAHLRARSFPKRRLRSMALFLFAYTSVWAAACLVLMLVLLHFRNIDQAGLVYLLIVVAAVWQFSPAKQQCLNRCHQRPVVAAFGGDADRGALRYGARHAMWCVGSCWALMSVTLALGALQLPAMAAATVWIAVERKSSPSRPAWESRVPRLSWRLPILMTSRSAH